MSGCGYQLLYGKKKKQLVYYSTGQRKGKRQPLRIRGASVSSPRLTTFLSVDATQAIRGCCAGDPRPRK